MKLLPYDRNLAWTPYAWLIYIVPFVLTPLYSQRHANVRGWTLHLTVTAVFLALYFRSYWIRGRELGVVTAATVALGVAFWPVSHAAGSFFIYGAAMVANLEPSRNAARAIAFIAMLATVEAIFLGRNIFNSWWPVVL